MTINDLLRTKLWQDPNYEIHQMNCPAIQIEGIDSVLYAKLLSEADFAGAKFNGTDVSISGCEFEWGYDATSQTLHVTCTKKPFYATCPEVESKIRELVEKSKGAI